MLRLFGSDFLKDAPAVTPAQPASKSFDDDFDALLQAVQYNAEPIRQDSPAQMVVHPLAAELQCVVSDRRNATLGELNTLLMRMAGELAMLKSMMDDPVIKARLEKLDEVVPPPSSA